MYRVRTDVLHNEQLLLPTVRRIDAAFHTEGSHASLPENAPGYRRESPADGRCGSVTCLPGRYTCAFRDHT